MAKQYRYDPLKNKEYQTANKNLQAHKKTKPTYSNPYEAQQKEAFNQIMNRPQFQFDVNKSALYQQMVDQAVSKGQLAMKNTIGQSSALTGGYSNTFAQQAGQQAFDAYLQGLTEAVPEIYGQELAAYNQAGDDLMNKYGMITDKANEAYGKYRDQYGDWQNDQNRLQGIADQAYNRGKENWLTETQMTEADRDRADAIREREYAKIVDLITKTGYKPSKAERKAAGMSWEQYKAYKSLYDSQMAAYGGGSGGSGSGGGDDYVPEPADDTGNPGGPGGPEADPNYKTTEEMDADGIKYYGRYEWESKRQMGLSPQGGASQLMTENEMFKDFATYDDYLKYVKTYATKGSSWLGTH